VKRLPIILGIAILAVGIMGDAYAIPSDITLSNPVTVDMNGHQKSGLRIGEPAGFSSVITSHSMGEKRFTYVVRVLDQNNQILSQQGLSANIVPNQSFIVAESWTPEKAGTYTVQTFLLDGYMISSPPLGGN